MAQFSELEKKSHQIKARGFAVKRGVDKNVFGRCTVL